MGNDSWIIALWIAVAVFVGGILLIVWFSCQKNDKANREKWIIKKSFRTTVTLLFAVVFISSVIIFLPIYKEYFENEAYTALKAVKTILLSVHNTIRLFVVDGEFDIVRDFLADETGFSKEVYSVFAAIIYVFAPMLTFSFVMTFFERAINGMKMVTALRKDIYVFSELNENSLAFAEDIRNNRKKAAIIFTDVYEDHENEQVSEKIERAKELHTILLKNDITDMRLGMQRKDRKLYFIVIGSDEEENMLQSLKIMTEYKFYPKTALYLLSFRDEAEAVFEGMCGDNGKTKPNKAGKGFTKKKAQNPDNMIEFHRVNPARDLVDNLLYKEGTDLFAGAKDGRIGVVVLGLGEYGSRMLRALSWFLQMDGYKATIDAFDIGNNAEEKMKALCPELFTKEENKSEGEAYYDIEIHSGMDIFSENFYNEIEKLRNTTYVFIAVGTGEINIKAAMRLRIAFERMGIHPVIEAVSESDEMNKAMTHNLEYMGRKYDLRFVGSRENQYREDVIFRSELQKRAFALHMSYYKVNDTDLDSYLYRFRNGEYSYHSSISAVIHMEAKKFCKVPGFVSALKDGNTVDISEITHEMLSKEDRLKLQILEHKRWESYVRSEGYIYGEERNDLGRIHPSLVPFEKLTDKEKEKDIRLESDITKALSEYGYLYNAIDAD